jgi:hypothetical protein
MGTLKIKLAADVSGPLADGTAEKAVDQWLERTTQRLGDEAVEMLRAYPLDKSGRAHGAFQSMLQVTRVSVSQTMVRGPQERGVVWSPWLEGTSSRNESTGFKGYHLFRKTRQQLQKRAPQIGEQVLSEVIGEMGGG